MIGVLDSGFGGLSVLKGLLKELPEYDYIYLGDNARAPYGGHSRETIVRYSEEGVEYLFGKGAKLIIVACNTISALALRHVQNKYIVDGGLKGKKNILGVIFPACEAAVKATRNKRVGLVGTKGTIESKSYETEIHKLDPLVKVFGVPCPLLVPLIEEGWHEKPETKMILKKYLRPLKSQGIDVLILGCTHYPLLMSDFKRVMGGKVALIGDGEVVAKSLRGYLAKHSVLKKGLSKGGRRVYLTTDEPGKFKELGEKFLGNKMGEVEKVAL
ncbi:MAG: glutamate racemase, glutamate racemase [Candidatus Peregrinibacteria bacterium GW2011_GWF2_43_17]|nr:MAG: glutamate racemase, glutamate racemase [Candidatus Peregrinibacteria bacterium GW2011_GWF2_43_17]HAU40406.1 glutamate racemase [Candidatus Peregrinibacteria bacterium]